MDMPSKSVAHQKRQIPRMINVRMSQNHSVEFRWRDREWLPVAITQLLEALEQPAVDQQGAIRGELQTMATAGDAIGTAMMTDGHLRVVSVAFCLERRSKSCCH